MNRKMTPDIMSSLLGEKESATTKAAGPPPKHRQKPARVKTAEPEPVKAGKTKATFYITSQVLEDLESLWLELRGQKLKYSKGDIVELGIQQALKDKARLIQQLSRTP